MNNRLLWPPCSTPDDLSKIEATPLRERGLPASTYDIVLRAARLWPDRIAITALPDGEHYLEAAQRTFAQLADEVTHAAKTLRQCGVGRTDAVALISPNCVELIAATLAAEAAGVAAPINGSLSDEHIAQLVRLGGARVVIAAAPELDPKSWNTAAALVAGGTVDTVLLLRPSLAHAPGNPAPQLPGAVVSYLFDDTDVPGSGAPFDVGTVAPNDLAALFHTGGTTGTPKLAAHTHANEVADAWMVAASAGLDEDSVIFAGLPLFHVNALVVTVLAPLLRGQPVVWAGPLGYRDIHLYQNFWPIVERYRLAAMSAVPTVYAVLANIPVTSDSATLRSAVVGASALPEAVRQAFENATGVELVEGYGLTEATCASVRSFADHPRVGSVGQRMPYQQVKTIRVDDAGIWHDLPAGEVGTLAISGPTVFPGYVTAHTDAGFVLDGLGALHDGWLNTGDLARIDADGFVYLAGRSKDLIIRGGHNIDPALVEDALLAHPDVTAAAAVGRPDVHAGEVPVAYVTVRPGATVTGDELTAHAAANVTERAAAPKTVTVIEALPLTDIGKPGVQGVHGDVTASAPTVRITLDALADRRAVEMILTAYTLTYRIETS
ncbi:MAG: acyl-CoA synthetase [Mycobacterium sp.]|nr:acyl-CoA synthetase [Mycobacterium sp.]